ncbi:MAG: hypothetical protein KC414_14520, partial [Romboutsia sp.]|nr:hypothetical protein [Romboutsia sp.]
QLDKGDLTIINQSHREELSKFRALLKEINYFKNVVFTNDEDSVFLSKEKSERIKYDIHKKIQSLRDYTYNLLKEPNSLLLDSDKLKEVYQKNLNDSLVNLNQLIQKDNSFYKVYNKDMDKLFCNLLGGYRDYAYSLSHLVILDETTDFRVNSNLDLKDKLVNINAPIYINFDPSTDEQLKIISCPELPTIHTYNSNTVRRCEELDKEVLNRETEKQALEDEVTRQRLSQLHPDNAMSWSDEAQTMSRYLRKAVDSFTDILSSVNLIKNKIFEGKPGAVQVLSKKDAEGIIKELENGFRLKINTDFLVSKMEYPLLDREKLSLIAQSVDEALDAAKKNLFLTKDETSEISRESIDDLFCSLLADYHEYLFSLSYLSVYSMAVNPFELFKPEYTYKGPSFSKEDLNIRTNLYVPLTQKSERGVTKFKNVISCSDLPQFHLYI